MDSFITILNLCVIFCALYFQVFILISLFESKKRKRVHELLNFFPETTIVIPCWNEEDTIARTVDSVLALDYPQDKMRIMIVDDGSTDNTQKVLEKYKNNPMIAVFRKENGGKFSALNFGLERLNTEYFGCLDADSFVDKQSLKNIMRRFVDPTVMAVTPATIIDKPDNILRKMQKAEYNYGNFMRKGLDAIGATYITPGPFSFFRKAVFEKLGPYKHAHNTEDMEIGMRMQKNKMKIVHAPDAIIHTVCPDTIKKLYKQRVRWLSGFLGNLIDYKHMLLKKEFGDLGVIVLPFAVFYLAVSFILVGTTVYELINIMAESISKILIIGFHFEGFSFDWFFINTSVISILTILLLSLVVGLIMYEYKNTKARFGATLDIFYFLFIYSYIAPFWIVKSIYNNVRLKHAPWR